MALSVADLINKSSPTFLNSRAAPALRFSRVRRTASLSQDTASAWLHFQKQNIESSCEKFTNTAFWHRRCWPASRQMTFQIRGGYITPKLCIAAVYHTVSLKRPRFDIYPVYRLRGATSYWLLTSRSLLQHSQKGWLDTFETYERRRMLWWEGRRGSKTRQIFERWEEVVGIAASEWVRDN